MKKLRQEQGLTLIEMTVILAVLTILSGMLAPSILQFIEDSKTTRARADVQAIANGITHFYQDTGHFPVTFDSVHGGLGTRFIDVLVSEGLPPKVGQPAVSKHESHSETSTVFAATQATANGDMERWRMGQADFMDNYLNKNRAGFAIRGPSNPNGWNGPYLNSDFSADPWGNQYLINVAFLDSDAGVADVRGVSKNAVFVLCAGPNQTIETPFTQPIVNADVFGDDIASRIR